VSGLAGLFHRDGRPADPAAVAAMLAAVPYRGLDGSGTWHEASVALGHVKLAVTPEDAADRQPIVSQATGCVLVADVRLDNRQDLLGVFPDLRASAGERVSDAAIVLRAYEVWGEDSFARLLGDFALVIWDARRRCLVAARDTSGQRPLYYRADLGTFAFASEIHQLFQDPAVAMAPNEARILDDLTPHFVYQNEQDRAATYYDGILALPAGHRLNVTEDELQVRQYWTFQPPRELRYRRDEDYEAHFRDLLFDVVAARLRSSHPVGALLSGGLDSSSVVCVAQELYRAGRATDGGFVSLSAVFDGLECDERMFVEDVREKYRLDARFVRAAERAARLALAPAGFRASPLPGTGEREALLEEAERSGVRAVLTGDVADACVRGSRAVLDSLILHGRLAAFRRHLRAYRRATGASSRQVAIELCLLPLLPLFVQRPAHAALTRRLLTRYRRQLLPSWMAAPYQEQVAERNLELSLEVERHRQFRSPARELEYRLLYPPSAAPLPAGWPVEIRRPFADRRLHEFLLAIPPEQKFEPHPDTDEPYAGSKWLVRRALRGILPESVRTRTTPTHFGAVFVEELRRRWSEYEAAFGPGAKSEVAGRGLVNQDAFWSRLEALRNGAHAPDLLYVVRVVGLETWLRALAQPWPHRATVVSAWRQRRQEREGQPAMRRIVQVADRQGLRSRQGSEWQPGMTPRPAVVVEEFRRAPEAPAVSRAGEAAARPGSWAVSLGGDALAESRSGRR
jgi:asparagine synthase (glutamine-hydrolysing)